MRPKRVILLVDEDEQRQSETRYMLRVNGFDVLSFNSADAARKCAHFFDLVLGYWPVADKALRLLARRRDVRFVLVCPSLTREPAAVFADAILVKAACQPAFVLERIKCGVAKRRGPKSAAQKRAASEVA
jgi:hypothetical protein